LRKARRRAWLMGRITCPVWRLRPLTAPIPTPPQGAPQ
jgi:hypothetical protein